MKLAILATRTTTGADHYQKLQDAIQHLGNLTEIHHGGEGAGAWLGQRLAADLNLPEVAHRPDWTRHGRAAGPIRGKQLVAAADVVVALWDGRSKGTQHELKEARRQNKPIKLVLI